ncbi:uncharacterized protein LOC116218216 [Clupea harengus]|uniref:Uncharacterized protein LOC116218216 n=1 Tax=Clupea harengus TaxID=7950 RepID=A0A6P8EQT9_CLUHA|nr:uncharacterized protein LOC116218216 [Clupea harengus]
MFRVGAYRLTLDEDRVIASQAVQFVLKGARKGVVHLCSSVAELLRENLRLQQTVEAQRVYLAELRVLLGNSSTKTDSIPGSDALSFSSLTSFYQEVGSPSPPSPPTVSRRPCRDTPHPRVAPESIKAGRLALPCLKEPTQSLGHKHKCKKKHLNKIHPTVDDQPGEDYNHSPFQLQPDQELNRRLQSQPNSRHYSECNQNHGPYPRSKCDPCQPHDPKQGSDLDPIHNANPKDLEQCWNQTIEPWRTKRSTVIRHQKEH